MKVDRQKLRYNCEFHVSVATLSHEMKVGRRRYCGIIAIFTGARQLFSHEMPYRSGKIVNSYFLNYLKIIFVKKTIVKKYL